jgi:hypothetical protein
MDSGLVSLSKLFTERLFRIPDYQRGYSWKEKQLKEFWADIEQLESGRNHYLGVLTLELVSRPVWKRWSDDSWLIEAKNYNPYHVVDGQQRLTTIIILLQCIVEAMKATEKLNYSGKDEIQAKYIFINKEGADGSFLFGYERDNPSYEFLKTHVLQRSSSRYTTGESTLYTKNLHRAKEFFKGKLATSNAATLQELFSKTTQHLLLNVFHIEKEVDVHVAFETMNNRGLQLSTLELLKNRLIYLTTRMNQGESSIESLRRTINDSWKTVYYYLGKNPGVSLSDDFFLQTHYLMYFAKEMPTEHQKHFASAFISANEFYREYLLEDRFSLKRMLSSRGDERLTSTHLYQYSIHLKQTVEQYYFIQFPEFSKFSAQEKIWLERLRRLRNVRSGREIFVILLLMIPQCVPEERINILKTLERYFFFTGLLPYKYTRKNQTLKIGQTLLDCAAKRIKPNDVMELINEQLSTFDKDPNFTEALTEGFLESGYYEWRDLRYFMYEYECHLKVKAKRKSDKIDWNAFIGEEEEDHSSIEHILPQTPKDPTWKAAISGLTPSQVKKLTNSLGNLVATSAARNSSLQNAPFEIKKGETGKKTGYRFGSYSEVEVGLNATWGQQEILNRGLALLDFVSLRWGVNFSSDEQRRKCLGLEFLKI